MKTMKKICILFLIMLIFMTAFSFNNAFASTIYDTINYDGGISGSATSATTTVTNITSTVLTAIRYVGSGVSLIMLTVIFIKYMLSAASEKAEIKKNLIPFTIGAIVLFAASNLVLILQDVATKMFG